MQVSRGSCLENHLTDECREWHPGSVRCLANLTPLFRVDAGGDECLPLPVL